jgi:hypothetical protein
MQDMRALMGGREEIFAETQNATGKQKGFTPRCQAELPLSHSISFEQ